MLFVDWVLGKLTYTLNKSECLTTSSLLFLLKTKSIHHLVILLKLIKCIFSYLQIFIMFFINFKSILTITVYHVYPDMRWIPPMG